MNKGNKILSHSIAEALDLSEIVNRTSKAATVESKLNVTPIKAETKIPYPQNIGEFFAVFEKMVYLSDITPVEHIDDSIDLINCVRKNPFTKNIMLNEDLYLIDIDSTKLTINLPLKILKDLFDITSKKRCCFISRKTKIIFKTTLSFILYFVTHDYKPINKMAYIEIGRLLPKIEQFASENSILYDLFLKINHRDLFPRIWKEIQTTQINEFIRNEILEFWEYDHAWIKRIMRPNYIAQQILDLIQIYKRKLQKDQITGENHPVLDTSAVMGLSQTLELTDNNLMDQDQNSTKQDVLSLKGQKDTLINGPIKNFDELIEANSAIYRTLTNKTSTLQLGSPKLFNFDKIANTQLTFKLFLEFQIETDELNVELLDINDSTYECSYVDSNEQGELTLFDTSQSIGNNSYRVGVNTIRNLFDENQKTDEFRLFFIDPIEITVMETTTKFIFFFLKRLNPDEDTDLIDELNKINKQIYDIQEHYQIPFVGILNLEFDSMQLILHHIQDFPISESITQEIIGIWQYEKEEDSYIQIFPEKEEQESNKTKPADQSEENKNTEDPKQKVDEKNNEMEQQNEVGQSEEKYLQMLEAQEEEAEAEAQASQKNPNASDQGNTLNSANQNELDDFGEDKYEIEYEEDEEDFGEYDNGTTSNE
jgi:hypothetical protein